MTPEHDFFKSLASSVDDATHAEWMQVSTRRRRGAGHNRGRTGRGGAVWNRGGAGPYRGGTGRGGAGPFRGGPGPFREDPGPSREDPGPSREDPGPSREDPGPSTEGPGPFRGSPGSFRGWAVRGRTRNPHDSYRPLDESVVVTNLGTLKEWTNLSSLDNSSRILTKLLQLQSSWVKYLQTDAPVAVLNLAFDILSDIPWDHRYAKVALLKSLFTYDFILRLVQIVELFKNTWPQEGKGTVQSFVAKLRNNMEFLLSNAEDFHNIKFPKVAAVKMLVDECVEILKHIVYELKHLQGRSDPDLELEIAAVQKLLKIELGENLILVELHPNDFRNPFAVEANIVHGPYLSDNHYIETQVGLLKEDFQIVLREGVEQYMADPKKRNFNVWSYENVVIKRFIPGWEIQRRKLLFEVKFPGQKKYFTQINWKSVKRFMFGSLVVITADKFNSYHLARVEDAFLDKPSAIRVVISFLYSPPDGVEHTKFLLVEPKAFYEPYLNSMKVLKRMAKIGLPLKKYVVDADTESKLPSYLSPRSVYQIGSQEVKVNSILSWSKVTTDLNPSQKEAFIHALTSEVALIQGPPGTGKTFLAYKIIETLLRNHLDGPIMVVCYKNHSLDQILEGLLKNKIKVVRIGGGSKNPDLQNKYNCKSLYIPQSDYHPIIYERRILEAQLRNTLENTYRTLSLISLIKAQIGVLNLGLLEEYQVVPDEFHLSLEKWLLGIEAPQLSLEQIKNQVRYVAENAGTAQGYMSMHFTVNLLSVGSAVISYCNTLSDMEEVLDQLPEEMMLKFWEINEQCSYSYALYCSLYYGLNLRANSADCPHGSSSGSLDYSRMKLEERWALYRQWEYDLVEQLEVKVHELQRQIPEIEDTLSEYDEMVMGLKLKYSRAQVIGVTTTGASKHFSALADVGPKVVLVEEAAEVLEAHIITSLSNKCQHLILIGDHQQLKPSTASYTLATEYGMDVSLFERLIKNDMKVSSLVTQHRMRPEITALICPSIYENLENHPSVQGYPNVRGTKKNVYFFDHRHHEESGDDSESKSNPEEAEMLTAIAYYLLKQGYSPDQITILSTYMDQNRKIQEIIDTKYDGTVLTNVLCTVVDNYQGEENIIILLSLVRSNYNGHIGFLKTKNRICVGLSRAKHGLFIFGNMSCLTMRKFKIWEDINRVVADQDAISTKFPLKCVRHSNITEVACPEEVDALENGGCINPCNTLLSCSHTCRVMCHSLDLEHIKKFMCRDRCLKKCSNGHRCKALCQAPCPECPVKMTKRLVCGHSKQLQCHLDNLQAYCNETVETKLEMCGHTQLVWCRLTEPSKRNMIFCQAECKSTFSCGHVCKKMCHVLEDPDHKEFQCEERCELINERCPENHRCERKCREPCGDCQVKVEKTLPCGHKAKVACTKDVEGVMCTEKCSKKLLCGHDCSNACQEACGPCKIKVEKVISECGHKIQFSCPDTPARSDCEKRCKTIKSCGHKCAGLCNEPCSELFCKTLIKAELPCGHDGLVPCGVKKTKRYIFTNKCEAPCQASLPCGHRCKGTCGTCLQGRVHIPCYDFCDKRLLCSHKCQVRCCDAYHSCTKYKCFKMCWGEEVECPPSWIIQGRGKRNRIEIDPQFHLANEIRWSLIEENVKMWKMARGYSANKSIALQVKQIQLDVNKSRTNIRNDEDLLTLKTSLFKVEFVSNVLRIAKRLERASLSASEESELEHFLETLVDRTASRHPLGTYEMTQLQEQIVWVSLVLDVHDLSAEWPKDSVIRDMIAEHLTERAKIALEFRFYGKLIGSRFITDVELKGLFPVANRFCSQICHHSPDNVEQKEASVLPKKIKLPTSP